MHRWPWYPGTGAAEDRGPHSSVWNVPLPPGLVPERYLEAIESAIESATTGFTPDIVLISAGFDSLNGDPLGGFTLEPIHIAGLTERLVARAQRWRDGRVVSVLEGGYNPDRLAQGVLAHLAPLAKGSGMS